MRSDNTIKTIRLEGVSNKGRQKIRDYGEDWIVREVGSAFSVHDVFVVPALGTDKYSGCWVNLVNDPHLVEVG